MQAHGGDRFLEDPEQIGIAKKTEENEEKERGEGKGEKATRNSLGLEVDLRLPNRAKRE